MAERTEATRFQTENLLRTRIAQGEELKARTLRTQVDLDSAYLEGERWNIYNLELLGAMLGSTPSVTEYRDIRLGEGRFGSFPERVDYYRQELGRKLNILRSIVERLDILYLAPSPPHYFDIHSVFLVHGHDTGRRDSVARFLEKLGLNVVILQERAGAGRTIVEQFEQHSRVGFAVILLTSDDIGSSKDEPKLLRPRARQNVIFELGYFCGFLGRARVCALYDEKVELPSDFHGVIYVSLNAKDWKLRVAQELRHADMKINPNSLIE